MPVLPSYRNYMRATLAFNGLRWMLKIIFEIILFTLSKIKYLVSYEVHLSLYYNFDLPM